MPQVPVTAPAGSDRTRRRPRPRRAMARTLVAFACVVTMVCGGLALSVPSARAANNTGPADLINDLQLAGAVPLYSATPAQQASLEDLEQEAVANTLTDHGLPQSDAAAAQTWGRDAAEQELWALLLQAIQTPAGQQTTDQANAVAWLTSVVQRQNVQAADDAGLEYAKWAGLGATAYENLLAGNPSEADLESFLSGDPVNYGAGMSESTPASTSNEGFCVYVAPAPDTSEYGANIYQNQGTDQTCYTPCTNLLGCAPSTPSESDFVAWGAADADDEAFDNSAFPAVANDVGEAAGFGAALVGVGSGLAIGLTPAVAAALGGTTLASILTPFGGISLGYGVLSASEAAEAAAGIAAADLGAVVGVVLVAIAVGVIEAYNVITAAELPDQLAQLVYDAPTTVPDLASMLQSSSETTELYSLFIGSTLPEPILSSCDNSQLIAIGEGNGTVNNPAPCLNAPAIPAYASGDPTFDITEKGSSTTTTSSTLTWADTGQGTTYSGYVVGSWFVDTETAGGASLTVQTLDIHYTNWSGQEEVAWLVYSPAAGYQFVTYEPDTATPIDIATCASDGTCALSDAIEYVGTDGNDYSATLSGIYIPDADTPVATTTSVSASSDTPIVGEQVTFTATISDSGATGTVTFTDGSTTLCANAAVQQVLVATGGGGGFTIYTPAADATCTVTLSTPGSQQVTASYSGGVEMPLLVVVGGPTSYDTPSVGELTVDAIQQVPTTTSVAASVSTPVVGQLVTYTATVADSISGSAPTGTVTFTNGSSTVCSDVALTTSPPYTATCSQTYQAPGDQTVSAGYSGDADTLGSSGQAEVMVTQAATSTSLSASPGAPTFGRAVTLTATVAAASPSVAGPAPTGTVTFSLDGQQLGAPVALSSHDQATSTPITDLAPGLHHISASYSGNADYLGSSAASSITVTCAQTITATYNGTLNVTSSTCVEGAALNGPVNVRPGGTLALIGATVRGPVSTNGAASVLLCSTTVRSSVTLDNSSGPVQLGGPAGSSCGSDNISGPVTVFGAHAPVSISSSTLTGPVSLVSDSAGTTITDTTVNGPLSLAGDSGGVTVTGNTVHGPLSVVLNSGTVTVRSNTVVGPVTVSANYTPTGPTVSGNVIDGPLACSLNTPPPTDGGVLNKTTKPAEGQCAKLG